MLNTTCRMERWPNGYIDSRFTVLVSTWGHVDDRRGGYYSLSNLNKESAWSAMAALMPTTAFRKYNASRNTARPAVSAGGVPPLERRKWSFTAEKEKFIVWKLVLLCLRLLLLNRARAHRLRIFRQCGFAVLLRRSERNGIKKVRYRWCLVVKWKVVGALLLLHEELGDLLQLVKFSALSWDVLLRGVNARFPVLQLGV